VPLDQLGIPDIVKAMLGEREDDRGVPPPTRVAQELLSGLLGRVPSNGEAGTRSGAASTAALVFERVSVAGVIEDVDLVAPPGQIIGLTGLVGAGHHACIELVAGLRRPDQGRVLLPGGKTVPHGLPKAIDAGVAYASGDRRRYGLMLDKSVWENVGQVRSVALARDGTLIRSMKLRLRARKHTETLRVRTPSVEEQTGLLSGGNQQKVVFAKWLDASPSVLLLDDPTRGVDVGAKAEMHALIRAIADAGAVVLLCSTDIDELVSVCDRLVVFHRGRICVEIPSEELNSHDVLEAMNTGSPAVLRTEAKAAV
jgi:ribose transport system ATP-binding protein/rhamnose transport system ATP-binding protein